MDQGIISLPLGTDWSVQADGEDYGQETTSLVPHFLLFPFVQIWSMDSDRPVHSLKVNCQCMCLAWRPNRKTDDVDGGIAAARKSKDTMTIAW